MKERPILFSAPMVQALLDGSKTQTRRVITHKKYPVPSWATFGQELDKSGSNFFRWSEDQTTGQPLRVLRRWPVDECGPCAIRCPYGQPGDRLWVRETFQKWPDGYAYRADYRDMELADSVHAPWKPSIHMPRAASRITIEITSVRAERLQDISEADAIAEGVSQHPDGPWHAYRSLWTLINGPGSWDLNPWVWVIEFKKATP